MRLPLLVLHITAGTLGMLSGFVAIFFRKGSRQHRVAGNVFVISMLSLSASGVYLAFMKSQPGNVLGGTLTFYLVATAWTTARHRDGEPGIFEWGALLVVLAVGAVTVTDGLEPAISQTGLKHGYPAGPYFFLGSVALLAATGDVRMLVRSGISGTQRIARHLWRMCFALFIAASSIFLARQQIFPALLRKTGVLLLPSFLPLIFDDFLAIPSSLHKCIQEEVNAKQWRCLLVNGLAFDSTSPQDTQSRMGNIRSIASPFPGSFPNDAGCFSSFA